VLAWWIWTRFDWTLWSIALCALKEELYFFATATLAVCSGITSHLFSSFLKLDVVSVGGSHCVELELHQRWLQLLGLLLAMNGLQFRVRNLVPLRKHQLSLSRAPARDELLLLLQAVLRMEWTYVSPCNQLGQMKPKKLQRRLGR
jgi:hypothetical protein